MRRQVRVTYQCGDIDPERDNAIQAAAESVGATVLGFGTDLTTMTRDCSIAVNDDAQHDACVLALSGIPGVTFAWAQRHEAGARDD